MKEIYIIIEEYYDCEGYTHRKPFNESFYLSEEEANKVIETEKKRCEEDWDPVPDLRVMKLERNQAQAMKIIPFRRNWCDYLTPCPYRNKAKRPEGIMVGDYECFSCKYRINPNRDKRDGEYSVACEYEYLNKQ